MEVQIITLPAEVETLAKNVSLEKRNEVILVLNKVFAGVEKMRSQLDSIDVVDENDKVNMQLARTIRLGVRDVRLDAEKNFDTKRTEVQQAMLSYKTEDSLWLKAKQTMQILTKEIEQNAKWKEETKERIEVERRELTTQQRINEVAKFAEINRFEFENMSDESFNSFLSGLKTAYELKIETERLEKERIEKERLAEIKKIEAQRIENEKLKLEAEKREKEIEAERKLNEQKLAEAKAKAEKIEAELKAQKDAEIKAENERKEAELKAQKEAEKNAKAPIKKQLSLWVESFEIPFFTIENDKAKQINAKFEAFKKWAKNEIENV
jgi:hypothetical protein